MHPVKYFLLSIFILFFFTNISAQWVNDPTANLMVCDLSGAQSLPKIASTSDGGCYISWFDNRSGEYCVYMQRLDPFGYKQWGTDGLLISSNPQMSSLVDYSLISDAADNAILIFSDIRNAGNLNVFAYKISPAGTFLWGINGVALNPTADFQPNGKVVQTDDGGYVFAWIVSATPTKTALQKLSSDGVKLWGTLPIILQGSAGEGFNYPSLVKSDNNAVLLLHTFTTGSFPAQTVKLRAQKLTSSGSTVWGTDGISIQNLGKIAAFQVPVVISDGMNGAFISWYDDRDNNNLQSAFVQRVSSDSLLYFPVNGAEVSITAARQKYNPVISFESGGSNTYVFWRETEPNQSQNGIMGQKLSSAGARLWGDNGKIFKDLSAPNSSSISNVNTKIGSGKVYVFYLEGSGSGLNTKTEGFACDFEGQFVWPGSFVVLSNPTQEKLHLVVTSDIYNNCKLAWGDRRIDEGIYAQDINPSGQLGNPVTPVELISFTADISTGSVILKWVTASELNNYGFNVERKNLSGNSNWNTIGFVEGKGNSSEVTSYTFNDRTASSGTYLYRLKQLDYNGNFILSEEIKISTELAGEFTLEQNYPNPFNPATIIRYSIPVSQKVSIKIYDALGREIMSLIDEFMEAGNYELSFSGTDLSSGIYYCRMTAGDFNSVTAMTLIK
jgi:hypothetical protein